MVNELDNVVLTVDIPEYNLKSGDIGTVVLIHQAQAGYEVEFTDSDGFAVAVISVFASQVRPAGHQEIAHARTLTE